MVRVRLLERKVSCQDEIVKGKWRKNVSIVTVLDRSLFFYVVVVDTTVVAIVDNRCGPLALSFTMI